MLPAFVRLTIRNIRVNVDVGTLSFLLGLPALYFFVLGLMLQGTINDISIGSVTASYTSFLAPGIMAMQTLTAGNIGGSLLWSDRRWGMFEQLMVGPFRRSDYLLGIIFVSVFFSLGGSLIVLGFAYTVGTTINMTALSSVYLIVSLTLGSIFFASIFLIIAVLAKTMQAYNTITIVLFFLLDFASTAFVPITSGIPVFLRNLSGFNPLSAVANIVRDSTLYGIKGSTLTQTLLIAVLTVIFFFISMLMYRKVRTGT